MRRKEGFRIKKAFAAVVKTLSVSRTCRAGNRLDGVDEFRATARKGAREAAGVAARSGEAYAGGVSVSTLRPSESGWF